VSENRGFLCPADAAPAAGDAGSDGSAMEEAQCDATDVGDAAPSARIIVVCTSVVIGSRLAIRLPASDMCMLAASDLKQHTEHSSTIHIGVSE
jgi:hypothetical protein